LQKETEAMVKREKVNKIIAQVIAWACGIAGAIGWILFGWGKLFGF
jgi:hypothetical protein